ncbi:hypothetical protein OC835_002459 [Tilletia horrida]|nr:hypothetical protein OC835_002459 [Tilletia horrida]
MGWRWSASSKAETRFSRTSSNARIDVEPSPNFTASQSTYQHRAPNRYRSRQTDGACDESGQELVQLPIEFLRLGQVQTVAFALQMVAFTFVEPGTLLRDGQQLQPDGQVTAGDYVFRRDDALQEPCTPHTGPRGKIKHTPFSGDEASSSTMSNSKRSSAHQSRFCFQVAARDSLCLVTGADPEDCTAAHILPVTRLDYYVEVLGNDRDVFEPSAGLFLRDDLHHAFDRFEFAFWPLANGDLVVHIFNAKSTRRPYHGKVVPMPRF